MTRGTRREARTQGASICGHIGATEDAASWRVTPVRRPDPFPGRAPRPQAVRLPARVGRTRRAGGLVLGLSTAYLSLIVLVPIAAVVASSLEGGLAAFWEEVTSPAAVAALELTFVASLLVVVVNAVTGTLIAWVLVRDDFRGKSVVNALIDLPFALPTIVAGLTLLAVYGPKSPFGGWADVSYTRTAIVLALLFVTLPFVVRAVQPVLVELDREMEEAAASLGARPASIFRRIVLPNLTPAILSGAALSFGKAVGEFGSIVLISGNIPFDTEVASVHIFKAIEGDDPAAAAAVSVVLLVLSFAVLVAADILERRSRRHDA